MGKIEYNILDIHRKAFGYQGKPFPFLVGAGDLNGVNVVKRIKDLGGTFTNKVSTLGQDLFMPISLDGYQLPDEPLISIRGSKNLVQTPISGSDGTNQGVITELTGISPYRVRIRGVIVNSNYQANRAGILSKKTEEESQVYPKDEVSKIADICLKAGSVKVENFITAMLGIDRLIIEDFSFPEVEGVPNAAAYEISAYSEQSLEANILNQ